MGFLKKVEAMMATLRLGNPDLKPKLDAFYQEFLAGTERSPLNPQQRIWQDKIIFEVKIWDNKVWMSYMQIIDKPKTGFGTKAMAWITNLADKHQVPMGGVVKPVGNYAMPKSALLNFYKKFSFTVKHGDIIHREPKH